MSHIIDFESACNKIIESTGAQIDIGGFVKTPTKEYPEGIMLTRNCTMKNSDYIIYYSGRLPLNRSFRICFELSPTKNKYCVWSKPKSATKYQEFLDVYQKVITDCILWTHEL